MNKILVIANTTFSIEKFRSHYLKKLSKDSDILVLTPQNKPNNLGKVKFVTIRSNNTIEEIIKIIRIIRKFKPDDLLVYAFKYQLIISFIKKFFNIRIIFLIAGKGSSFLIKNPTLLYIRKKIIQYIIDGCHELIFINPLDRKFFIKNFNVNNKAHLIPTEGLELIKMKKKFNNKRNFLYFARIIQEKGIMDYIKAAKVLKKKFPNSFFYIAGPIDKYIVGQSSILGSHEEIINEINRNKEVVSYIGYVPNFLKIFKKIDCLISPSFTEGAGTSIMEAMMCGLFVIGYKNNGHQYVLKNTKNYLCKQNNPKQLVKNVEKFLMLNQFKIQKNNILSYNKIKNNFSSNLVYQNLYNIIHKYNYTNQSMRGSNITHKLFSEQKSIDIVMPFYKDYSFLDKCLMQINKQTFQPKKLIFIDDGNKDSKLREKVRNKLNKNIDLIFIKNHRNSGPEYSVDLGLKKVTSKYFYIESVDDSIYKNFFSENINCLEKFPDSPFVFSDIVISNLINRKKYKLNFSFLKNVYYNFIKTDLIYKKHQFKIYHNTVVFNSKKFFNDHILTKDFGKRRDMLNLQYLSYIHGFCYLNKFLSEFTVRQNQYGKVQSVKYLIEELKFLKHNKKEFFNFFIKNNLHFDIPVTALFKLWDSKLHKIISLNWFIRSFKFYLWKKTRFTLPPNVLNRLFFYFN